MISSTQTRIFRYNTDEHPLRRRLEEILGTRDLEMIAYEDERIREQKTDQSSEWHRQFYAGFEAQFQTLYDNFCRAFLPAGHVYQRVPTFRVHAPENLAVGSWHRDRDFGHQVEEVNYWLPFTQARNTNSVWIEHQDTFFAADLVYSEVMIFDGANLLHGNVPNISGQTRVSIDFRSLPLEALREEGRKTVSAGREFKLGDYWSSEAL